MAKAKGKKKAKSAAGSNLLPGTQGAAASGAQDSDNYEWSAQNIACVATYRVLEGDEFLDQFEDVDISFDDAPEVKLSDLWYYPKTSNNARIIEGIAFEMARDFLGYVADTYVIYAEDPDNKLSEIVGIVAKVFESDETTILDLAKATDKLIKFPGEQGYPHE